VKTLQLLLTDKLVSLRLPVSHRQPKSVKPLRQPALCQPEKPASAGFLLPVRRFGL
jgi:hypothetical protein